MRAFALQYDLDDARSGKQQKAHAPIRTSPWAVQSVSQSANPVVQRKSGCACGGDCPHCQQGSAANENLRVSNPGDALEREADHAAESVMRTSDETTYESARQLSGYSPAGESHPVPAGVSEVLRSPGQPLDVSIRDFMESRFGHDFSAVKIHTDHAAAESARGVRALAYTVGSSIVFGAGQFAPHTHAGRTLIAHELSHVVQQGGSAGQATHGSALARTPNLSSGALLQRQTDGSEAGDATPVPGGGDEATPLQFGEEVRARCIPLGCPLSTMCGGQIMALTNCGTGTCRTCPPGLGNLVVRSWCEYTSLTGSSSAVILNLVFGGQVGPFCM